MNKTKHFLLLAAMLFSSHVAWGATFTDSQGLLTYYYTTGTNVRVNACNKEYTGDIVIPETIENGGTKYTVNRIYDNVFDNSKAKSITIPSSVTTIDTTPFSGCTGTLFLNTNTNANLTSTNNNYRAQFTKIVVGEGVTSIPENAFDGLSTITSVSLPSTLQSIGNYAFNGCSGLESIEIPSSVNSIGTYAFQNCSKITSVSIPETITTIGAYMFNGCSTLASVTLPENITSIGNNAFDGCSNLEFIVIPEDVTTIGNYAFRNCSTLTSINIPSKVTNFGTTPFSGCTGTLYLNTNTNAKLSGSNFSSIVVGEDVTTIPATAFQNLTSLKHISIPTSVNSIGNNAFSGCSGLESLTILSNNVTFGATTPLNKCTGSLTVHCNLTAANLNGSTFSAINFIVDEGVTEIPANTYANIKSYNLASITLPSTIQTIGSNAFDGFKGDLIVNCNVKDNWFQGIGISSLTISEGVESIGNYAFSGCSNLPSIVLPSSITQLGDQSFSSEANLTSVDLSKCSNLETLPLYLFAYNPKLSSVSLPNTIQVIDENVFLECTKLAAIVLPENLETIGTGAFNNTSLSNVSIPASVDTISQDAFINCKSLETVTFNGPVETIGVGAFIDCTSLTTVEGFENTKVTEVANALFRGCTSLNDITLPSTITRIGEHAFKGSQLTSIDIPAGVTSIESETNPAFKDCSKLTDVTLHSLPTGLEFLPQSATITMSLTDASNVAAGSSIGNANVTYTRAAGSSTWGTICLPFATQSTDDVTLYQLTKVDMEQGILTVEAIEDTVPANTPCLYKKVGDVGSIVFEGNGSVAPAAEPAAATVNGWTPKGTYQQVKTNQIYYISRNEFHYATETATITINPFRAWFAIEDTQAAASRRDFKIAEWEASTGVSRMLSPEENEEIVYNLFGQQLGKARVNEINIVNGKKCLVK